MSFLCEALGAFFALHNWYDGAIHAIEIKSQSIIINIIVILIMNIIVILNLQLLYRTMILYI